jgi:hypothetical protein
VKHKISFIVSFAKSTTSSLNIVVYDFLCTIYFFSPWVILLGKFLSYKSLRLKEHMYFKMEAVSTSIESHNWDDATKDGSNHVTHGMGGGCPRERKLREIYTENNVGTTARPSFLIMMLLALEGAEATAYWLSA